LTSLAKKLKHEMWELIPVFIFFFITFQLLAITESLMLEQYNIKASAFIGATLMAMVISKVVVIADHFRLVNQFPHKPLVYNVVWKTGIYFCASFAFRYVEHLIHFWRHAGSFAEANRRLFDEIVWPHFWGLQLWLLILLLVYCSIRELVRALGRAQIIRLFFIHPQAARPPMTP